MGTDKRRDSASAAVAGHSSSVDGGSRRFPVSLSWQASSRFLREYHRASPPLQVLAEHEIRRMQVVAASRKDWMAEWRRLRGVRETVLEVELGGGPRLLAHVGSRTVTLVAMGDHEVTTRYARRGNLAAELRRVEPLPAGFAAASASAFFPPAGHDAPRELTPFWPERSQDWLYFLDEHQATVCDGIVDALEDVLADDDTNTAHLIVGGPGTGKTSLLLQLLKRLSDQVAESTENLASRPVRERPGRGLRHEVHRLAA